ncbi:MAG: hypothetical protein JWO35_518 [Candidatus Saccharibacteria bacterium]|nr:hypothetical protein [Candidatus Saccharibacteria bacterium]
MGHQMAHNESQVIDLHGGQPLADAYQTKREVGLAVPTVAKIEADRQLFSVLDTRLDDTYASPLLVVSKQFRDGQTRGFKGVWLNDPVVLGRGHHTDRFDYDPRVSGSHFSLAYDGLGLIVQNLRPTNKTLLSGDLKTAQGGRRHAANIRAVFTQIAEDDIYDRYDFGKRDIEAPYGYSKNHPIIGRDSKSVKNGVYFTTRPDSEAVVVDDKSRAMQQIAQDMIKKAEQKFGREPTVAVEAVLKEINKYTRKVMPYDHKGADKLSRPHYAGNTLIGLSEYIEKGVGVCRHQCLVAAFLAETLVEKKMLIGQAGVERNHDVDAHGAHAWAVFKTPGGLSFVIDPAQNFVGTKEKAHKQGRWKYDLPVDR